MIAACPKCQTRYRVEADRLGPDGARLRCSQCSAVFRVRVPAPTPAGVEAAAPAAAVAPVPVPAPPVATRAPTAPARTPDAPHFDRERLVLVAHPNADACKRIAEALEVEGLQVLVAHDGVEAILSIQRALPRAVVLDAALPKMFGFQVCELVKRNESLRTTHVCLMGAIHKDERYRRAPHEIYGADFYVEPPALPGALFDWLARVGLPLRNRPAALPEPAPMPDPGDTGSGRAAAAAPAVPRSEPAVGEARTLRAPVGGEPRPAAAEPRAVRTPAAAPPTSAPPKPTLGQVSSAPPKPTLGQVSSAPPSPLDAERAQAERLARIIVSDIVLYNQEKFSAAVRSGNAVEALRDELAEGRALFRERIDARVREERDFLAEELERVARTRGTA